MADKARHAFGALENIDSAISSGKIDSYDILFVKDAEGKPYVGWVDKDGKKVICDNEVDLSGVESEIATLESELATKANSEDVETLESKIAAKADAAEVVELKLEIADKADVATVQTMIKEYSDAAIEVIEF